MDTISAFAMGEASRGKEMKVFDWDRAATLIKEFGASSASAGLSGDWEYTGGIILEDGKPAVDSHVYLSSTWATPELEINGTIIDCYKMQSETDGWDAGTFWPDSARAILNAE